MAPCESCPSHCPSCAWDHKKSAKPKGPLVMIRTSEQYGCVKGASVVVDSAQRKPFMQIGSDLHPLSVEFGRVIVGTRLERDIQAVAMAV